jgi:hypothetical protein
LYGNQHARAAFTDRIGGGTGAEQSGIMEILGPQSTAHTSLHEPVAGSSSLVASRFRVLV